MQLAVLGGSQLLGGGFLKLALFGASVAGSILLKGKQKPVGKLNDLRVSSASYGRGIPMVWGTMRTTGNMFWATDFREEKIYVTQKGKEKTGGKGEKKAKKGKAQPVYKYYANFAMGMCQGPADDVIRIWADNNLIYDKLNPENEDLVTPGFSTREEETDGKGSQKSAANKKGSNGESGRFAWRFYPGTEDQLPDPYMEKMANERARADKWSFTDPDGNTRVFTPAYRDLCYLMFEDFALEDFGNRIPTITAEITMKTERRSEVAIFTNMPDPVSGWSGRSSEMLPDMMQLDITRNRIVTYANTNDGYIARIFDMTTRQEVSRVPFGSEYPFEEQFIPPNFLVTKNMVNRMDPIGMSHKGDLVFVAGGPNYKTVNFFDSNTGALKKSWGGTGVEIANTIDKTQAIFGPSRAFPFMISMPNGEPRGATMVRGTGSQPLYLFDDSYTLKTQSYGHPAYGTVVPGAPGTDHAIISSERVISGNYQYNFYKSPCEVGPDPLVMGPNTAKFFSKWPEVPFSNTTSGIIVLSHFGFVVGAEAVCCVFRRAKDSSIWAVKIDPYDGSILWEYQIDDPRVKQSTVAENNLFATPQYINTNVLSFQMGNINTDAGQINVHIRIDFRSEKVDVWSIDYGTQPPIKNAGYYWSEQDAYIYTTPDPTNGNRSKLVILYQDRKLQKGALIVDIVKDVAAACDVPEDRITTDRLVQTDEVIGYMVEQPMEGRNIIEELSNIFQFDAVESEHRLHFVSRNQESITDIVQEKLGIVEPPVGGENEYYVETRLNESELPRRATMTYFNPKEDYEQATQIFNRPGKPIPVMGSNDALELSVNMALDADVARSLLTRILYAAWSERKQRTIRVPRDYLMLDPTDVITIVLENGEQWMGRITDVATGDNLEIEISMVSQVPRIYELMVESDSTRGPVRQPPVVYPAAEPIIMNIPYIEDADVEDDAELMYYWGAGAFAPGFKYGVLQAQAQDSQPKVEGSTIKDLIWGYLNNPLPAPPAWNITDTTTQLQLIPAFDFNALGTVFEWQSIPDNEWPSTKNMLIVGGEILLFKNVEVNPDNGVVTVSHLIRGYRGSISNAYLHNTVESRKWALIFGEELRSSTEDFSLLNTEQLWNINTGNIAAALSMSQEIALDGATRKPLPVGGVKRSNPTGTTVRIQWARSTRYNGALKAGTATIPLNEESEKYSLYLLKAPFDPLTWDPANTALYHTVKENLTTSTYTFSSTELGTYGMSVTSTFHVVIYQISADVGLGYPHGLALPYYYFGV